MIWRALENDYIPIGREHHLYKCNKGCKEYINPVFALPLSFPRLVSVQ